MTRFPFLITAIFLSACAGAPKYPSNKAADAACVKGDMANFFKFFSAGEAHVHIKEIDGVPTEGGTGPFCFVAGKHRLGISGYNNHQTAQNYVELTFASGKQYWIRGNLRGMNVYFEQIDITSSEEKVAEFSMPVNIHSNPAPIPIFIPIAR